ncbi:hypothetical protein EU513_13845 [Yimella sp. RIT 621]|uniref:hypothetical protein n=1 Tax=Yimella sp. RIT 621 TaxID=2510323 RepID=UPI00101BC760|nr:hypothetical protein [Yimella sp. RIT 621]RYG76129.1 hypothetical protein EU513_13845 [Yimella sp. RIT 621]
MQTDGGTLDYSNDAELRVGTFNGGSTVARSFIMFPTAAVQGKQVTAASLSLYENWSWSCTASGMTLSTSGAPSAATRWGNQPTIYSAFTTASFAKGASSACPAGRVSLNMLPLVTSAQTNKWTQMAVALKAANEADSNGWKRFGSSESANPPYVTWTYNRAPNQAAAPTFVTSGVYGNVGYVAGGKVTFTTKAADADGSQVKALVEVHNSTTVSSSSKVASCTTPLGASAASVSCVNDMDMPNGGTYYVRALTTDEKGLSAGSWSSWTTIRRAGTAPVAPSISCPGYANGSWTSADPATDVTCTVATSGSGVLAATRLDIYVDGAATPTKSVDAKQTATSTTVVIPRTARGGHSVRAVAVGGANLSSTTTSTFGWGPASMVTPVNGATTSGRVRVTATGTATNVKPAARVQWRLAGTGSTGWVNTATATVTTANGVATASGVFDTANAKNAADGTEIPERTPVTFEVQVCFDFTTGSEQCTFAQSPWTLTRVPHAFGDGYPTKDAGDAAAGQVAQFTGEYQLSSTDVTVPGMAGDLSVGRSHLSMGGDGTLSGWAKTGVASSVFGPGWTASFDGPEAGAAGLSVIDNTGLDGTIVLADEDGTGLVFRQPGGTTTSEKAGEYSAVTQDTVDTGSTLKVTATDPAAGNAVSITLTDTDGTITRYTKTAERTGAGTTVKAAQWGPHSVTEPGAAGTTTFTRDSAGRPTRITSGLPDGFTATDCPATGLGRAGCRYLDISYGTTNAGTDAAPGERSGQVKTVSGVVWDPAASGMVSTVMASYAYDGSGRLVRATDARTGLVTSYTWDGAGASASTRLASLTPPGQAAFRFSYDSAASGAKLVTVTRDAPVTGGSPVTLAKFFYNQPVASSPVPDIASKAGTWAQTSLPDAADGVFVMFGPDRAGAVGSVITTADWPYADVSYTDALGYEVNTASYGAGQWLLTATDYDTQGNVVRTFDTGATSGMLSGDLPVTGATVDAKHSSSSQYSTETRYNNDIKDAAGAVVVPAGTRVEEQTTPAATVTMPDGTELTGARRTVTTTYDQGAPNANKNPATGKPYGLPTTVTTTVDGTTVKLTETTNSYTPVVAGDGDGWALGSAVKVTTDGSSTTTRFDTAGRIIETRDPSATAANTSASPQATQTIYYTAGANARDASCGGTTQSAAWPGRSV